MVGTWPEAVKPYLRALYVGRERTERVRLTFFEIQQVRHQPRTSDRLGSDTVLNRHASEHNATPSHARLRLSWLGVVV